MKIIALIATLFYVASAQQPYVSYRSPFPGPAGITYVNGVTPVGLVAQPLPYTSSVQHPPARSYYQQAPVYYQQQPQVYHQQTSQSYPLRVFQQAQQYPAFQQTTQIHANPAYQQHIQQVQRDVPVARYQVQPQALKTRKYEIRRPAIENTFYDIEERVIVRPAGSALLELEQPSAKSQQGADCDTPSKHEPPTVHQPQYPQYPQPGPTIVVKHPVHPQPTYPSQVPKCNDQNCPHQPQYPQYPQPGPTIVVKHPVHPQPTYPTEAPKYYPQQPPVHQPPVHEPEFPQYPQPGPTIVVSTHKGEDCVTPATEHQYPRYPQPGSSVVIQKTYHPQPKYYPQQPNHQHFTISQQPQPQQQYVITPVPASYIPQQSQQDHQKFSINTTPAPFIQQQPQQPQFVSSSTPAPFIQQQPQQQQQQQFVGSTTPQQQFVISSTPAPFVHQPQQQQQNQQFVISSTPAPFVNQPQQQQQNQQFVISSTPAPFNHQQQQQQFIISSTPAPFIQQQPQQQYGFGSNTGFVNQQQPQQFIIGSNPVPIQQQPSFIGDQSQQNYFSSTPTPADSFSNDDDDGDEDSVVINARSQPFINSQNDSSADEQKTQFGKNIHKSEKLRNNSEIDNNYNYKNDQEQFSADGYNQQQNDNIGNQFMSARLQSADEEPERGDQGYSQNDNQQQNYQQQQPQKIQINPNDAGKNQQALIQLLTSKNNGVSEVGFDKSDGNNYGNAGVVRARVISATPAHDAEPTDERTNTRRVVVSRPIETVQEVSVVEPVSKFGKLTAQYQRPAYRTPQLGLQRTQANANVPIYVQPINQQQYGYSYNGGN